MKVFFDNLTAAFPPEQLRGRDHVVYYTLRNALLPTYFKDKPDSVGVFVNQSGTPGDISESFDIKLQKRDLFAVDKITLSFYQFDSGPGLQEFDRLLERHPILQIYMNQLCIAEGAFIPVFEENGESWMWTFDIGLWIFFQGKSNIGVRIVTKNNEGFKENSGGVLTYHGVCLFDFL
jgi:hypothetical protein